MSIAVRPFRDVIATPMNSVHDGDHRTIGPSFDSCIEKRTFIPDKRPRLTVVEQFVEFDCYDLAVLFPQNVRDYIMYARHKSPSGCWPWRSDSKGITCIVYSARALRTIAFSACLLADDDDFGNKLYNSSIVQMWLLISLSIAGVTRRV